MARNPAEAINLLRKGPQFKEFNDGTFAAEVADQALSMMWDEYGWRGSLVDLPPFYLTPGEVDSYSPFIEFPTDFLHLEKAWLRQIGGSTYDLTVMQNLIPSSLFGRPELIAYLPEKSGFRVSPKPSSGYAAPFWQVEGAYKKKHTTITAETLNSTDLPFEDRFFEAYKQALKYVYMDTLGNPQAGQASFQGGFISYSGQLGKYKAALHEAIEREEIQHGDKFRAPTDSLMLG